MRRRRWSVTLTSALVVLAGCSSSAKQSASPRTAEIQDWIGGQLSRATVAPGADLLGAVARGVNEGTFTDVEAKVILHTLLSAGSESTTSLLGNAVRILAEHSDLQQHLRAHPELIPTFVEEAVRLESPFRYLMRSTRHDTAIGGVEIPADATILLLWGAANRDETEFAHPDIVDLERAIPKRHVAFGRGIHHCVGAPLARMEARGVLTVLLAATSSITLDPDRQPRWVNSLMARRHDYLPVRMVPSQLPSAAAAKASSSRSMSGPAAQNLPRPSLPRDK